MVLTRTAAAWYNNKNEKRSNENEKELSSLLILVTCGNLTMGKVFLLFRIVFFLGSITEEKDDRIKKCKSVFKRKI